MREPDFNDFMILVGLGTLGAGLWMLAPWLALVALGIILTALGLYGAYAKGRAAAIKKQVENRRGD